jgi:tetratricopeptide (TPR) repeat protein
MEAGFFVIEVDSFGRELATGQVRRGYAKYQAGNAAAALAAYLEARRLLPEDPYVHYLIGRALARLGRLVEARASFRETIRLHPAFIDAHYQLGRTYLAESPPSLETAREALQSELAVYPYHGRAHYALYQIFRKLGDRAKARAALRRAGLAGYRPPVRFANARGSAFFRLVTAPAAATA